MITPNTNKMVIFELTNKILFFSVIKEQNCYQKPCANL